jgi:hypothetical protein
MIIVEFIIYAIAGLFDLVRVTSNKIGAWILERL